MMSIKQKNQELQNEAWDRGCEQFLSMLKRIVTWISTFFCKLGRGFNGPITLVTAIFLILVTVETCRYKEIIVNPILIPQELIDIGYTPDVAAARITDSSNNFHTSTIDKQLLNPGTISRELDLIMPTFGVPIRPIARYLRDLFDLDITTISGEIMYHELENQVSIRLRKDSVPIFNHSAEFSEWGMNELFDKSGYQLAKVTYPFEIAIYHYNRREYIEAEKLVNFIFSHLDENEYKYVLALNLYGVLLFKNGQYDEAISKFNRAITISPTFIAPYNNWAAVLAKKNDYPGAVMKFMDALRLDPNNATTYVFWCGALLEPENLDIDIAIERCEKALELDKHNIYAYVNLGIALMLKRDYLRAIENYEKALELDPYYTNIYINWGKLLTIRENPDYPGAIDKYKKAIELDPNNINAYLYWGFALANNEDPDWDEVIDKFMKVTELNPKHSNAYINWGYALASKVEPDYLGAIEKFKKAIELDPNNVNAYQKWAYVLTLQGDYTTSAKLFECANILSKGIQNYLCRY